MADGTREACRSAGDELGRDARIRGDVDDGGSESADGDLERINAWCLAEGPDTDRCRWSGALGGRVGYGPATGTDTDRKRDSRNRVSILVLHDKRWLDGQRQSGVERPARSLHDFDRGRLDARTGGVTASKRYDDDQRWEKTSHAV